jgi:hypothetical protein
MKKCCVTGYCCCCGPAKAEGLIRLGLGLYFLIFGINKFVMGIGTFAQETVQPFAATWFPSIVAFGWLYIMPILEVLIGLSLIFWHQKKEYAYFAAGVFLLIALFGVLVLGNAQWAQGNMLLLFALAFAVSKSCECKKDK